MNCDGLQTLACIKPINRDITKPAILSPLGHMFVLKDLVVDMTNFYIQHKTVDPYLKRKTPKSKVRTNVLNLSSSGLRKKKIKNYINPPKIVNYLMDYMNASYALAVHLHVQATGGGLIDI